MIKPASLVDARFGELFQTERSAVRHCAVEADRLGQTLPGLALRAVSSHAKRAEADLERHATRRGIELMSVGKIVGALLSNFRDYVTDFTLTSEESYRATLLGMRHGCDVVALVGAAARIEGDVALATWCAEWLAERCPLVERCADALSWFASYPELALCNAKTTPALAHGRAQQGAHTSA